MVVVGKTEPKTPTPTFTNRRDWSTYLTALQTAAQYPKVMEAVKSGRAWFTAGATQATHWLVGTVIR